MKDKSKTSKKGIKRRVNGHRHTANMAAPGNQITVIQEYIDILKRSFTDPRDGSMDPDAAHKVFCLESAIRTIRTSMH